MRLHDHLEKKYLKNPAEIAQKETQEQQKLHLSQAHYHAWLLQIQHLPIQRLKIEDALSFLSAVKLKFVNCPLNYVEFLDLLKECRSLNADIISVIGQICQLFQGYPDLIRGFCNFLPPAYSLLFQTRKFLVDTLSAHQNTILQPNSIIGIEECSEKTTPNDAEYLNSKIIKLLCQFATGTQLAEMELGKSSKELSSVNIGIITSLLKNIKNCFNEKTAMYKEFIKISNIFLSDLESTNDNKTKNAEFLSSVSKLFEAKPSLIEELQLILHTKDPETDKCPKHSRVHDESIASIGKHGSLKELAFFDKVKRALNYHEVYDNFLRCLMLYNSNIITRIEVVQLVVPFIGKFPELLKEFQDILGMKESGNNTEYIPQRIINQNKEKIDPDLAMDVDYSTGRKHGISYRALPKNFEQPKCTGRSALCKEVLNDMWVSFPSWSEDSTFVSSCKTQYEEIIYRCEDERFELDIAVEANACTIQDLDAVQKKINKMSPEEKSAFCLSQTLGGSSEVHNQRSLKRVYGDKTDEIVESLMKNPVATIPSVLKRLKAKEEEWKSSQAKFNDIWTEQNRNYYLKSLDHQGINFKQNDSKFLRSKSLLNEIETLYEEKKEQISEGSAGGSLFPHLILEYRDVTLLHDVINLISQHTRQLTAIHREDRRRMEQLLFEFVPDFFGIQCGIVPDDDIEQDETVVDDEVMSNSSETKSGQTTPQEIPSSPAMDDDDNEESDSEESSFPFHEKHSLGSINKKAAACKENSNSSSLTQLMEINLPYNMFFVNNNWYLFFRHLHILCDRLCKLCSLGNAPVSNDPKQNQESNELNAGSYSNRNGQAKKANGGSTHQKLINMVSSLLCGALDSTRFEDEARAMFGIHAYISFTMDKIVHNIVRQLQQIISDETCKRCTAHYIQHTKDLQLRGSMCPWDISILEVQYQKKVAQLLSEENFYKVMWHKKEQQLTIELLDVDLEVRDEPCEVEKWSDYVEKFCARGAVTAENSKNVWTVSPVYLNRNLLKAQEVWKKKYKAQISCEDDNFVFVDSTSKPSFPHFTKRRKRKCKTSITRNSSKAKYTESATMVKSGKCNKTADDELRIKRRKLVSVNPVMKSTGVKVCCKHNEKNMCENEPGSSHTFHNAKSRKKLQLNVLNATKQIISSNEAPISVINCESKKSEVGGGHSNKIVQESKNAEAVSNSNTIKGNRMNIYCDVDSDAENSPHTAETFFNSNISENDGGLVTSKRTSDLIKSLFGVEPQSVFQRGACGALELKNPSCSKSVFFTEHDEPLMDIYNDRCADTLKGAFSSAHSSDCETSSEISIDGDVSSGSKSGNSSESEEFSITNSTPTEPFVHFPIKTDKNIEHKNEDYLFGSYPFLNRSEDFDIESEIALEECQQLAMKNMNIVENTECRFSGNSYKMFFIARSESFMYRRSSFTRAREVHKKVSKLLNKAFHKWHKIWLDRYVTPNMSKCCQDWFLKSDWCDARVVCITENNHDRPPYGPFTTYRIQQYVQSD